ncbi:hypothetical protein [Alteromonas sp. RKMC-009]|uniref:hypothetical protein n=1 Tax=Alteromonas sp. RKMC-009 TaxID=2267264 RepID=UPI000E69E717|nr:hypothetical protein [Alteromonas sp. RKMC-009]AYA63866.1 hypothetical protein DS731_07535 [Alteromonas sp. RKMC-009]
MTELMVSDEFIRDYITYNAEVIIYQQGKCVLLIDGRYYCGSSAERCISMYDDWLYRNECYFLPVVIGGIPLPVLSENAVFYAIASVLLIFVTTMAYMTWGFFFR